MDLKQQKRVGAMAYARFGDYANAVKSYKSVIKADPTDWESQFQLAAIYMDLNDMENARLLIESSQAFIVNILGKESNQLMKHFFKSHEGSIFEGLKTRKGIEGIRILTDAVSYLECRLSDAVVSGDHVVYFGEVVGGKMLKGGEPSFHVRDNGFNY